MDLLKALTDEHRVIARAVNALDNFAGRVKRREPVDSRDFARFVCFFREFAELVHHDKEEHLLFPAMIGKGYARDGSPIAFIREQHTQERQILLALQQLAVLKDPLGEVHRDQAIQLAMQLVEFERAHMQKENELLYPAVEREFGRTHSMELAEKLSIAEQAERWIGDTSWLRDLADDLYEEYGKAPSG